MDENVIVVGADEAGRGLVIGPMVIGACALNAKIIEEFKKVGIKDSKKYSTTKKLFAHRDYIKKKALAWSTRNISAETLNNFSKNQLTMDEAEAYAFYHVLQEILKKVSRIEVFQVDNFQAVKKLKELLLSNEKTEKIELIVIPKAELKFLAVGAASILAKAQTINELETIKNTYGDFGSGSTSDKKTLQWLKDYYLTNKSWPEKIVRTYWKTIKEIEKKIKWD